MHTNTRLVELRVARFIAERLRPNLVSQRSPLHIAAAVVEGEPIPFTQAKHLRYTDVAPGYRWGSPWTTTWFHLTGVLPADWTVPQQDRVEVFVDLGFSDAQPGFQAEGMFWHADGTVAKGLSPRASALLWQPEQTAVDLFVEAAGNPHVLKDDHFAPTELGDAEAMELPAQYALRAAEIRVIDRGVADLLADAEALFDLLSILPAESTRRARVLHALDAMVDAVDPDDVPGTASAGRIALAPALAAPASASAHVAHAVGHAHIDSAWLWPVRETVRKCARTFSNVLALMDEYPDFRFACSSAQQYQWIKDGYPDLFERIVAKVRTGQWVPVGGMWVESDTNMPGAEAMARQLVAGKRFFLEELGVETNDVWLPDSFGYSGALPQLARLAGNDWFLTQKLSWNETDRMPHHTFDWAGIDGTRVLTHFPPVDSYNGTLAAAELDHAERNFAEKAVASGSLVPFGYGDGGGGPTREMLERAARYHSLEGVARVELSDPNRFFREVEAEFPARPVWAGEMYLEFHRGTYTSQARTKAGNRRNEALLHEAELWAATANVRDGAPYPYERLEAAWRDVLLNQFHDILPGSSIEWVYRDAEATHARVGDELESLIADALGALGTGTGTAFVNAAPIRIDDVPAFGGGTPATTNATPTVVQDDEGITIDNGRIRIRVNADGVIDSLLDLDAGGREVVLPGRTANLLQLFRDTPKQWDAWDIDKEYVRHGEDLLAHDGLTVQTLTDRVAVTVTRTFGDSSAVQRIEVRADDPTITLVTEVDWHETQKLLKLAFPLAVYADRSASETQFGHVFRPTHQNTSWDAEKFEICAHRWTHVGEHGYGVAVANDRIYGHDIHSEQTAEGATGTLLRQSLLRAPLFPDPHADQGAHRFVTTLRPGSSIADAVELGYQTAYPLREVQAETVQPLVASTDPAVLIETVKLAEDRSGDVVVRLYEAHGGAATTTLTTSFPHAGFARADLLERDGTALGTGDSVQLTLRPFEIVTVRIARA